jgi:hypothetical protein
LTTAATVLEPAISGLTGRIEHNDTSDERLATGVICRRFSPRRHGRRFERDGLAPDAGAGVEQLAGSELDGLTIAEEARAALDDEIQLLLLLALAELVVRHDEQLALVQVECVSAERLDAEEAVHVVRPPVLVRKLLAASAHRRRM